MAAVAPALVLLNMTFTRFTSQVIAVLEMSGVVYVQMKFTDSNKFPNILVSTAGVTNCWASEIAVRLFVNSW